MRLSQGLLGVQGRYPPLVPGLTGGSALPRRPSASLLLEKSWRPLCPPADYDPTGWGGGRGSLQRGCRGGCQDLASADAPVPFGASMDCLSPSAPCARAGSLEGRVPGPAPWLTWLILSCGTSIPYGRRVLVLVAPLPVQLSAVAREGSGGWPKCLGPCTRMEDQEEAPGSWLRIGVALAVAAILGGEPTEGRPFSLSLSLPLSNSVSPPLPPALWVPACHPSGSSPPGTVHPRSHQTAASVWGAGGSLQQTEAALAHDDLLNAPGGAEQQRGRIRWQSSQPTTLQAGVWRAGMPQSFLLIVLVCLFSGQGQRACLRAHSGDANGY
nr:uncharacterized protein LOC103347661 isoform X1 [Oryctolagus cuniculus]